MFRWVEQDGGVYACLPADGPEGAPYRVVLVEVVFDLAKSS